MNLKKKFVFISAVVLVAGFLFVSPTFAGLKDEIAKQGDAFVKGAELGEPRDIRIVAALIIDSLLSLLGLVTLIYMVYAGYLILTSAGEDDKIDEGKTIIRNAVIGLALILSAYSLVKLISLVAFGGYGDNYCKVESPTAGYYNPDPLQKSTNSWFTPSYLVDCIQE